MGTEELGRSDPVDWLGLLGGCDKTTPALIMGAISAGLPAIFVPAGPMLRGHLRGGFLGSGSDTWKYWDDLPAGVIGERDWVEVENGIARAFGPCMPMATPATMQSDADALEITPPDPSHNPP